MLVYRKILQAWFENPESHIKWKNINFVRNNNLDKI